jgi:hypothetical protein
MSKPALEKTENAHITKRVQDSGNKNGAPSTLDNKIRVMLVNLFFYANLNNELHEGHLVAGH